MLSFTAAVDQHQDVDSPTTWVRVVAFGEIAEQMAERLAKGARAYIEGRLEVSLWEPGDGRPPRVNVNLTASSIAPMGQIGRSRPRQTHNAERGQRTWDRSRDASRARQAGQAVSPEPPQDWLDDSDAAARDLGGSR
jgi:single-strand DNA-binding protein